MALGRRDMRTSFDMVSGASHPAAISRWRQEILLRIAHLEANLIRELEMTFNVFKNSSNLTYC